MQERDLGFDHIDTLYSVRNLATCLEYDGDLSGAELLYRRASKGWEQAFGPDNPETLGPLHDLAGLCQKRGDLKSAEILCSRVAETRSRVLGPEHPETLRSRELFTSIQKQIRNTSAAT